MDGSMRRSVDRYIDATVDSIVWVVFRLCGLGASVSLLWLAFRERARGLEIVAAFRFRGPKPNGKIR
jgi:hypothetical protein